MANSQDSSAGVITPRLSATAARAYWRLWLGARMLDTQEHGELISGIAALDGELRAMPREAAHACLERLATAIAQAVARRA